VLGNQSGPKWLEYFRQKFELVDPEPNEANQASEVKRPLSATALSIPIAPAAKANLPVRGLRELIWVRLGNTCEHMLSLLWQAILISKIEPSMLPLRTL